MTIRLDLRIRPTDPWNPKPRVLFNPDPFGCADCGQWFQFARELVHHICEARDAS